MVKNKALITAFSLSPKSEKILETLQKRSGKSRSEIIRNLLSSPPKTTPVAAATPVINPDDANKVLKYYYQLISTQTPKPTIVIGIGIVARSGKVLIGLRKSLDQYVKNLTWTFPSGKFTSLNFEAELAKTIKNETGLKTKDHRLIHARLIPDSPAKKVRIVALYYQCKILSGKPVSGGDFKIVKWVPATDVTKYFTTSVADELMNFLGTL
jgi:hypothetical protein